MASSEKEGENYLDTLLNTVAPDWEEKSESPLQSDQPDSIAPKSHQGESPEDKTLEDAMAILNDLPDMDGALELSENPEGDMDELFGLLSDLGVDPDEPEPELPDDPNDPALGENPELPGELDAPTDEDSGFHFNWAFLVVPLALVVAGGGGIGIALYIKHKNESGEEGS